MSEEREFSRVSNYKIFFFIFYLISDATAKHCPGPQTDCISVPLSAAQTLIVPARSELTTLLPSSIAVTAVTGAWCLKVATTRPRVKPHTRTVLSSDPRNIYIFSHYYLDILKVPASGHRLSFHKDPYQTRQRVPTRKMRCT